MQQYHRTSLDRHIGTPRKAKQWAWLLLPALLSMPLLLDGAKVTYAQWLALFGPKPVVATPAFDVVESFSEQTVFELRQLAKRPFRRLPWPTEWAVGGLVFSLIAGGVILKYSRLR